MSEHNNCISQTKCPQDSLCRLIESEDFTIQMAIIYVYRHKTNQEIMDKLFKKINNYQHKELMNYLPFIICILESTKDLKIVQRYIGEIATKSKQTYLLARWACSSFISDQTTLQKLRNQLDTCFINSIKPDLNSPIPLEKQIMEIVQRKHACSNYLTLQNKYYQKLFKTPIKLHIKACKCSKQQLKLYNEEKLRSLHDSFMSKCQQFMLTGTILPIGQQSSIVVNIIEKYCQVFVTKQHIPIKIVVQTLSLKDIQQLETTEDPQKISHEMLKYCESNDCSLLLPQSYFGQEWKASIKKIKSQSPYGHLKSYKVRAFMVKEGDDFRQQYMVMQFVRCLQNIFKKQRLKLWIKSYSVIPYTVDSGLIQFIQNTQTISQLKLLSGQKSLRTIYKHIFGQKWQTSITNFVRSLASYSLLQYLLQIKDRHNKNILIDSEGHIIHIDFSFILTSSPGLIAFQKAPFKLTSDYIEMMDGIESELFEHFKLLFYMGLKFIRKYQQQLTSIIQIMKDCTDMKCFDGFDMSTFEKRFHHHATDEQLMKIVDQLVTQAYKSYTTQNYDRYQWFTNDIHR